MNIAWTYLLHAYFRDQKIEYRYFKMQKTKRVFDKTARGNYKYWELERCLNDDDCPLDPAVVSNLKFLIGIRHEIEHQMTTRIDEYIGGKLQACCLNYNNALKELFGLTISQHQPISMQFFAFAEDQVGTLIDKPNVPQNVIDFIASYETALTEDDLRSPQFSYRVFYMRDSANRVGTADKAIRFINEGSEEGQRIDNVLIKNRQWTKISQAEIVKRMKAAGYTKFSANEHQLFWQTMWPTAKDRNLKANKYGESVLKNQWLWYEEHWLPLVTEHCKKQYSTKIKITA